MGNLSRFSPTAVLSAFCAFLAASLRSRAALQIEILALRHQLNVLQRSGQTATLERGRPLALGAFISELVRVANGSQTSKTGHRHRLALPRLPALLDLEIPSWSARTTGCLLGGSPTHSPHEPGESTLGSTEDPRRVAQTRLRHQPNQRE